MSVSIREVAAHPSRGLAVILCNSHPVVGPGTRLTRLQRRGTPVVLVDSRSPTRGQCLVTVDDVVGGDLAISHLLGAGHERIAYIAGPPAIRQVADRHEGALRALRRAGRAPAADDENHQHRQVIFEPELVVRQSTRRAPRRAPAPDAAPLAPTPRS